MKVLLGTVDQNEWRSRADTMEKTAKWSSRKKLKVVGAMVFAAKPKCDQPIHKSNASATIATPSTTDTEIKPPIFHDSGFLDGRTLSVAKEIFAKSVMKISGSVARAETTNLPITANAMATKAAFKIVWLILLMIHVRMR
jgi:hypothetical protein